MYVMDNLMGGINNIKCISNLFLDIKEAFDTVTIGILLKKLYKKVTGEWHLNGFVVTCERQQCANFKGCLSCRGEFKYGVIQGSVLYRILYKTVCIGLFPQYNNKD